MQNPSKRGFTLRELIMTIAIIAVISTASIVAVGNYITVARRTSDNKTLQTINEAIDRYRLLGGDMNAFTTGKPFPRLINTLATAFTSEGRLQQVWQGNKNLAAVTVSANGNRNNYHLTRFNTSNTEGPAGTNVPVTDTTMYVAIAEGGNAAYSSDGVTWTASALPNSSNWRLVAYGADRFIALSNTSQATGAYSTDGITWQSLALPVSGQWVELLYGNNMFVAISSSEQIIYSTNGIAWQTTTAATPGNGNGLTYGDGIFVSVPYNSSTGKYSEDGATWTTFNLPSTRTWNGAAYGNGIFAATTQTINGAYSYNGIDWSELIFPVNFIREVTFGNGNFYFYATTSTSVRVTADLTNWAAISLPANVSILRYHHGKFMGVSSNTTTGFLSGDGNSWTTFSLPSTSNWKDIAYRP